MSLADRIPPHSIEAEQHCLGSALISNSASERLLSLLNRDDFYHEAHRRIYDAVDVMLNGTHPVPVDLGTLPEALKRLGTLEAVGGLVYLNTVVDSVPTAAHLEYYAKIVKEKANYRRLIDTSNEVISASYEQEDTPDTIIHTAEQRFFEIGHQRDEAGFVKVSELTGPAMERITGASPRKRGVAAGLPTVEAYTFGWQNGDLIIIAGRPSMGKTALLLKFLMASALDGVPSALFSLEQPKDALTDRMISALSNVPLTRLKDPEVTLESEEIAAAQWAKDVLDDIPLYIDDTAERTVNEIRSLARMMQRTQNIGLFAIDHLGEITGPERAENETVRNSYNAKNLKVLARTLDVPVLCLSQLSREVEKRPNKRPMLSDLRQTGRIEELADLVGLLYRASYYQHGDKGDPDQWDATLLDIAKHRNGPVGEIPLIFRRSVQQFAEPSQLDPHHAGEETASGEYGYGE